MKRKYICFGYYSLAYFLLQLSIRWSSCSTSALPAFRMSVQEIAQEFISNDIQITERKKGFFHGIIYMELFVLKYSILNKIQNGDCNYICMPITSFHLVSLHLIHIWNIPVPLFCDLKLKHFIKICSFSILCIIKSYF